MAAGRRIKILIVDDSAVMRSLVRSVVCSDAGMEVVGTAGDGASALSSIQSLRPDLVLLDVEMPVMDGLVTLRMMRTKGHKMPVIMCSSLTQRGAKVTIEALANGAADYVAKPTGQAGREAAIQALAQDLIPKIRALTSQQNAVPHSVFSSGPATTSGSGIFGGPAPPFSPATPSAPGLPATPGVSRGVGSLPGAAPPQRQQSITATPTVLTIGVSTGGPAALDVILPLLPASFPLPVLIVQHMPELFTKLFAERLNGRCQLAVREAAEGDAVRPGTIYIAKGNWHMEVLAASRPGASHTLHLQQGPLENHCRPAVDVLFRTAAAVWGSGVLAVVLTGMGADGTLGSKVIREHGGSVLAQDQATSAVWGMPGSVANAGLAHRVLPLNAIVPEILRITSRTHSEARELRESMV
jgi:two-component system chemotaxis response regulator CheB